MDSELFYNTPSYHDPKPCTNTDCVAGDVMVEVWNEDERRVEFEKEKCPYCEDGFMTE